MTMRSRWMEKLDFRIFRALSTRSPKYCPNSLLAPSTEIEFTVTMRIARVPQSHGLFAIDVGDGVCATPSTVTFSMVSVSTVKQLRNFGSDKRPFGTANRVRRFIYSTYACTTRTRYAAYGDGFGGTARKSAVILRTDVAVSVPGRGRQKYWGLPYCPCIEVMRRRVLCLASRSPSTRNQASARSPLGCARMPRAVR